MGSGVVSLRLSMAWMVACLPGVILASVLGADACTLDRGPSSDDVFFRHLGDECTQRERDDRAVSADEVLEALRKGRAIDLAGVVVTGDVMLDRLPQHPVSSVETLPPDLRESLREKGVETLRVVTGPVTVHNSRLKGVWATNLVTEGYLLIQRAFSMTESTVERSVDFSRTIFVGPVDLSDTSVRHEAFFIQARFQQAARFERTAFGTHTRFFRATFVESAHFDRAGFNGLAEFLNVTFEKDASFSRAYFKMGTGFSGSRFEGTLDFSEALFEREGYFLYTQFQGDAYFRRTVFEQQADFSHAEFQGASDFSKVRFEIPPRVDGTQLASTEQSLRGLQDPRIQYGIVATLVIFLLAFVLFLKYR